MIELKYQNLGKISSETLKYIYDEIKTPYKYGAIIKTDDYMTDSPTIFKYQGKWYMYYVKISRDVNSSGYETHLSSSDDLLNWRYEGVVLKRSEGDAWDSKQCGGYAAFVDMNFGGTNEINCINGKYYMAYIGGDSDGYEPDPLHMGLAYSANPVDVNGFEKFPVPILSPYDIDARRYEKKTIYKSNMFIDENMTTGYRYINFYNAKDNQLKERIYLAVSRDAEKWERFGRAPIIDETNAIRDIIISGDPQIIKIDDVYVMIYFRFIKGQSAYNTFAVSRDLINWTIWDGTPLIKSEYEWENCHAHKSCIIKHNDVVYHYYCAVNSEGERFIALATSRDLTK